MDAGKKFPMEFANIIASDTTGRTVATAFSHSDGTFSLRLPSNEGTYSICISYMGYKSVTKEISDVPETMDLGLVFLEEGETLSGAEVTATALLRKESDRIVYDVLEDPDAGKMDMASFMEKIPGLIQDHGRHGKLTYNDMPISKILVDENESGLINVSRQYPMKFIQANYMSKIELVLPGSPEYNNTDPILVISLDEDLPAGFASELSAKADIRNSYGGGVDAVVNTPWVGLGINYGIGFSHPKELSDSILRISYLPGGESVESGSRKFSRGRSLSHDLGFNLFRSFADEKLDVQASVNTDRNVSDNYSDARSVMRTEDGSISRLTSMQKTGRTVSPMRFNGGLDLSYRIDRRNRIRFSYTYKDKLSETAEHMLYTETGLPSPEEDKVTDFSGSREHNANLSVSLRDTRHSRWSLLAFARYINRSYNNTTDYEWYNSATGAFEKDIAKFEGLRYRQQVAAFSAIFAYKFLKKKLSAGVGLNGDFLKNKGTFLSTGTPLDYQEFNVLPSASLSFVHKLNKISVSYSSKVKRPSPQMLNPYRDVSNPDNILTGNPELKGEILRYIGVSYSKSFRLKWINDFSVSYSYSTVSNPIERMTEMGSDNVALTTFRNIGGRKVHSVSASLRFRPVKIMTLSINGGYVHSGYTFADNSHNKFGRFDLGAKMSLTYKGWNLSALFHMFPTSGSAQYKEVLMEPFINVMLNKYFHKINLNIGVSCDDLFYGSSMKRVVTGSDKFLQTRLSQRLGRNFQFSVYWQFGKFRKRQAVSISSYDM